MSPVVQTSTNYIGSLGIILVWFFCFDRPGAVALARDPDQDLRTAKWQLCVTMLVTSILILILVGLAMAGGGFQTPSIRTYGQVMNVADCIGISLHWFLQLRETWLVQGLGSLSGFSLLCNGVGAFVTSASFMIHGGIWLGAPQLVAGVMMSSCLLSATYYERCRRKSTSGALLGDGDTVAPTPGIGKDFVVDRTATSSHRITCNREATFTNLDDCDLEQRNDA